MEAQKEKSKINWKRILLGIIIGAILVWLIGFAFWYLTRPKESKTSSTNTPKTATTSAKKDETADWKIYQSSEIGFSMKYPSDWIVSPGIAAKINKGFGVSFTNKEEYSCEADVFFGRYYYDNPGPNVEVTFEEKLSNIRRDESSLPNFKEENVILSGVPVTKISYGQPDIISTSFLVPRKGSIFSMDFNGTKVDCGNSFDYMLSTFKFLD